jgi:hypothetical protein
MGDFSSDYVIRWLYTTPTVLEVANNALAETINGLYKAELIHRRAPRKTKEAQERPWNGWPGSTTTDCSARLDIFHRLELR